MFKNDLRHTGPNGPDAKMTWTAADGAPSIWEGKFEDGNCTIGKLNGRQVNAADM